MLERVTGWAAQANAVEEIPSLIHEAFTRMRSGHPRPMAIQISVDVLEAKGEAAIGPKLILGTTGARMQCLLTSMLPEVVVEGENHCGTIVVREAESDFNRLHSCIIWGANPFGVARQSWLK